VNRKTSSAPTGHIHRHRRFGRVLATFAMAGGILTIGGAGVAAASTRASSDISLAATSSTACNGTVFKYMEIASITNPAIGPAPWIKTGALAAEKAVNASCEDGHPIQVIVCDDTGTAAGDTACGTEAVSDHVIAAMGDLPADSDNFNSILQAAGIPTVGSYAGGATDVTDPLSFPQQTSTAALVGEVTLAKDSGAKNVVLLGPNVGGVVQYFVPILKHVAAELGINWLNPVYAPVTTADWSPYVAQLQDENPQAIITLDSVQQESAIVQALLAGGVNPNKTRVISSSVAWAPAVAQELGSKANGLLFDSNTWFESDTKNAGIAQYQKELKAAGYAPKGSNIESQGVIAWEAVHEIADLMKGATSFTPASLTAAVKAHGPWNLPAVPPFNWSQVQFASDPVLSQSKLYSKEVAVGRANAKGQIVPLTNGYVVLNKGVKVHFP
jgi:Periplasmic binding protein